MIDTPSQSAGLLLSLAVHFWINTVGRGVGPYVREYFSLRGLNGASTLPFWRGLIERAALDNWVPDAARESLVPSVRPMLDVMIANMRASARYAPRPYRGTLELIRTDRRPDGARSQRDPAWGWRELARGGVRIHQVGGTHMSVLRDPHVREVAGRVQVCLDLAARGEG